MFTHQILRAADALESWFSRYSELLIAGLLGLAILLLSGCATQTPIAESGSVQITWEIGYVPGKHCGWATEIAKDHWLITFRRAYSFDDICVPHEFLGHALGAKHD